MTDHDHRNQNRADGSEPSGLAPMTCQELVELITDYLDGKLNRDAEVRFVFHLAQCPGCVTYLEQLRETIAAIGSLPPESLDDRVRDDLLEAFRGWGRHEA